MATKPTYTTSQITTQLTTSWGGTLTGYQFTWLSPSTTPITYSINTVTPTNSGIVPGEGGASLVAMTPTQVTTARLAFQLWADLMAKPLVESTNNPAANITLDYSSNTGNSTYTRPDGIINSSASSVSLTSAQVWMATTWSTNADSGMALGAYGLLTMIHEIGHALGISHPGTYNAGSGGTITYATNAVFAQDNRQYTVMSYFGGYLPGSGWQQDGTTLTYIYPQTPMVYDIAAIQFKYGANMTTRTDNTTYGFNSNVIGIEAAIYDFKINKTPILTIWDAGGVDTLDLSGSAANQNIDLTPGAYSSVDGMTNNVAIAFGTTIERAIGGVGNDTLTGGSSSTLLDGGIGNDLYIVKLAGDHLSSNLIQDSGGTNLNGGRDEIRFTSTTASTLKLNSADTGIELVTIGTGTAATAVSTGTTALNIDASALKSALTIVGNAGANNLIGGSGNDTIFGGVGNDTLTGGGGADYFVFNSTLSTSANLDLITDFQGGVDHLQLSKSIFKSFSTTTTLSLTQFYENTTTTTVTASSATDYLIYLYKTGGLYYDADGNKTASNPIEIAVIGSVTHPHFTVSDILLVA